MNQRRLDSGTSRRSFLSLAGVATLASVLPACSRRASSKGTATSASRIAEVMPKYQPVELVKPDIAAEGLLPSGYVKYPAQLVDAIAEKPGKSGKTIKSMMPSWGPTPPGLGRNSYLEVINAELGITVDPSVQDGNSYADKLSAVLGARDVPELLVAPNWEIDKIPRFSDAVRALFEDLTDYLKGDAIDDYPMLRSLPTSAWQYSVWGGRLAAVPFPTDGPFPWGLFHRKDLTDKAEVPVPKTIDELYEFGKKLTQPSAGVWAFGSIWNMVQMFFKCPSSKGGWRKRPSGGLEFKYEVPEFREALRFTKRVYTDGFVHPDLVASRGGDAKQLFNSGRILAYEDGMGAWRGLQSEQSKVTPGYNMQPIPIFSAVGGQPLAWGREEPVFYTFIRKGLGKERTQELLRVLNWCGAPFGSKEQELNVYGVMDKHFTRAGDGSPIPTELGRKEITGQYFVLGGRAPAVVGTADVPTHVQDLLAYSRETVKYLEQDLFKGIKVELPANYSKLQITTEDKLTDILRGRRPESDLDQIVREWRNAGGDEGRAFLEKTLVENGR